jgi:hypothetical protein
VIMNGQIIIFNQFEPPTLPQIQLLLSENILETFIIISQKMLTKSWSSVRRWGKGLWAIGCKVRRHLRRCFFLPQNPSGRPPFFPFLGRQPPFPTLGRPSPFPFAAALHCFLLSLDLPPCSKDREEEEQDGLKRKRGSRRCSTPISCKFS